MSVMDAINASFEFAGALFMLPTLWLAFRTKVIQGVHIATPLFFWVWGGWNLLFYPSVNAYLSAVAGVCVFAANTVWLVMVFYYGRSRT